MMGRNPRPCAVCGKPEGDPSFPPHIYAPAKRVQPLRARRKPDNAILGDSPPYFRTIAWCLGCTVEEAVMIEEMAQQLAADLAYCVSEPPTEGAEEAVAALMRGEAEIARRYGVKMPKGWAKLGPLARLDESRQNSPARYI